MKNSIKQFIPFVQIFLLCFITFMLYLQTLDYEFVNSDDSVYVTENPFVKEGLSPDNVYRAFTTTYANFWHPLTWLSHMLDCELYGLNPGGHHMTNLILHIANIIMLFFLLLKMTGDRFTAFFVAALFALHPLHVESVAWVAERKDVLSTLFWFLTIYAYLFYIEAPGIDRYVLIFLFFIMGLMSKPMVVTLPFVLLLLDYWPLGRLQKGIPYVVMEKIPLVVLSVIFSIIAYAAQYKGGAVGSNDSFPLWTRIANALVSSVLYIWKTLFPYDLAVFYPHRGGGLSLAESAGAGAFLLCITFCAVFMAKRQPSIITGWLWYIGTLMPVSGLVQIGSHSMADRYTYIPLTGIFIALVCPVSTAMEKRRLPVGRTYTVGLIVLTILCILTWSQIKVWRNSITLFGHAAEVTRNNYMAYENLANAFVEKGRIVEALNLYHRALEIRPKDEYIHYNIAVAYERYGNLIKAEHHYKRALEIKPSYVEAHNNLGVILAGQGKTALAVGHFSEALRLDPDFTEVLNNMGVAVAGLGRAEEAIRYFSRALEINPAYHEARKNLEALSGGGEENR